MRTLLNDSVPLFLALLASAVHMRLAKRVSEVDDDLTNVLIQTPSLPIPNLKFEPWEARRKLDSELHAIVEESRSVLRVMPNVGVLDARRWKHRGSLRYIR